MSLGFEARDQAARGVYVRGTGLVRVARNCDMPQGIASLGLFTAAQPAPSRIMLRVPLEFAGPAGAQNGASGVSQGSRSAEEDSGIAVEESTTIANLLGVPTR